MTKRIVGLSVVLFLAGCSGGNSHPDTGGVDSPTSDTPSTGDVTSSDSPGSDGATGDATMSDSPTGNDVPNTQDGTGADVGGDGSTQNLPLAQDLFKGCLLAAQCGANPTAPSAFACELSGIFIGYLSLVGNVEQPYILDYLHCIDSATSCSSLGQCIAGQYAGFCAMHPTTSTICMGNAALDCTSPIAGSPSVLDCSLTGQSCTVNAAGKAVCSDGNTCAALADGGTPPSTCNGNSLVSCDTNNMVEQSFNCNLATPSGTCLAGGTAAICIPTDAPSCTGSGASCDGTKVSFCIGGRQYGLDCAQLGGTCAMMTNDAGMSTPGCADIANAVCTDGAIECSGTHIQYCTYGHWVDVDCASIGFTTCMPVADAGFGGPSAMCM